MNPSNDNNNNIINNNNPKTVRLGRGRLTCVPPCEGGAVCHSRNTHGVVSRKALAAQDVWPGVAVTTHDGRTAVPNGFTQTPARGNKPSGEDVVGGERGKRWEAVAGGKWFHS